MKEKNQSEQNSPKPEKIIAFTEQLKVMTADEMQVFDLRATKRGGKFAIFAALIRGEFGDPDIIGEDEVNRRFDEAMAKLNK